MTAFLLDTNIWLRSVQQEAAHHPVAVEALATLLGRGDDVFITPQNIIEFWSVASRPVAANGLGWFIETVRQEVVLEMHDSSPDALLYYNGGRQPEDLAEVRHDDT
jgi:predicted nucleic acid-binding protein